MVSPLLPPTSEGDLNPVPTLSEMGRRQGHPVTTPKKSISGVIERKGGNFPFAPDQHKPQGTVTAAKCSCDTQILQSNRTDVSDTRPHLTPKGDLNPVPTSFEMGREQGTRQRLKGSHLAGCQPVSRGKEETSPLTHEGTDSVRRHDPTEEAEALTDTCGAGSVLRK